MPFHKKLYFGWVDALKAFAILGILLNHLVEEFGPGPWFTNPSGNWPDLATRMRNLIPPGDNLALMAVRFLGWLGDSGPGVFILLSGFGLALSALQKEGQRVAPLRFYRKRLSRIFPLYIAIHLLTLAGLAFIPGNEYSLAHPYTLLSLMGLRFTDSLFFYINPSWWFIWAILQLYLVFPFLYRMMNRLSLPWFLGLTLAFTVLCRGAGLLGIRYSDSLYYWMTGIFFGARLAEFTFGMALAYVMVYRRDAAQKLLSISRVLPLAALTYATGLLSSFFWAGTVVSNLLVTIGLAGLFYALWEGVIRPYFPALSKGVAWIGVNSFGVFLLHQTPLKWTGWFFEGYPHLLAALAVIGLSFPASWLIERSVLRVQRWYARLRPERAVLGAGALLSLATAGAWKVAQPENLPTQQYQFAIVLLGFALIALLAIEWKTALKEHYFLHFLMLGALFTGAIKLYLLPSGSTIFSMAFGFITSLFVLIGYRWTEKRILSWAAAFMAIGILTLAAEAALRYVKPLESPAQWGEYPALEAHPTRTYGLKPNLDMRLRYNNYDYRLKTNSYGLPGPEPSKEEPGENTLRILVLGDAFTMPEGMGYEQAYPAQLEKILNDSLPYAKAEVINAGVTGYGPNEQLPQLAELLPLFRPNLVLYQFFINEFEEIQLSRPGRLEDIGLISHWPKLERLAYGSQIFTYAYRAERALKEKIRHRPNTSGYYKSLADFYEKGNERYYSDTVIQKMRRTLYAMQKECSAYGARFVLVFVPGQIAVSAPEDIAYFPKGANLSDTLNFDLDQPLKYTRQIARELEIPLADLTPFLREHPRQPVYYRESWHWNPEGQQVVATALFSELNKRNFFSR